MNGIDDDRLNAFIDGELHDDERQAIERRMADDPRLAARVAELRSLGTALREPAETELPAGFYARATERFERSRRARRRAVWWRYGAPLGGLAAAALVLALFLPRWIADPSDPVFESPAPEETVAAREREAAAAPPTAKEREAPAETPAAEVRKKAGDAPPAVADAAERFDQPAEPRKNVAQRERLAQAAPPAVADAIEKVAAERLESGALAEAEPSRAADDELPVALPLKIPLLPSGEFRIYDDAESLRAAFPALGPRTGTFERGRLVITGPPPTSADCRGARITIEDGLRVVRFPTGSHLQGCTVVIPRDDLPLEIRWP